MCVTTALHITTHFFHDFFARQMAQSCTRLTLRLMNLIIPTE